MSYYKNTTFDEFMDEFNKCIYLCKSCHVSTHVLMNRINGVKMGKKPFPIVDNKLQTSIKESST